MELNSVGKWGLQLLSVLFSKVDQPFILYLDQHEKLVLTEDREVVRQNVGRLHSLVESIPKANGLFVVAGNEEAWGALPPDLSDRFAGNIVKFPVLSLPEAKEIIHCYLPPFIEFVEPLRVRHLRGFLGKACLQFSQKIVGINCTPVDVTDLRINQNLPTGVR